MNKALLLSVLLLTGCATSVPVTMNFPQVPEDLKTACPNLGIIEPTTDKLSKVVEVVSTNYGTYHECKIKVDAWIQWYDVQKKIYEGVK